MAVAAEISFTDKFWPSVNRLASNEIKQVTEAIEQLGRDPLSDGLRLKPVEGDRTRRKYTCRASQDIRLLVFKEGPLLLLERAGHHDAVYELSRRIDLLHNEGTGAVRIVERQEDRPAPAQPPRPTDPSSDSPRPFDHWSDADLGDAGLDRAEVVILRSCRTEDDVLELPLDEEKLSLAIDVLGQTPEQWRRPSIDPDAERADRVRRAVTENGALAGISPLFSPDELAKLMAAPIEDWMIFLHPDQRAAVTRRYEGPARIRGSAGTGKTVIALHRAAELVGRFRSEPVQGANGVLFTTFIGSLPPVFERLYNRLPQSRAKDEIEFWNVDRLARRICVEAGDKPVIDPRVVDSSWAKAWSASPLHTSGLTSGYIRDEMNYVIKGRGIRDIDGYLALERTGRRTRFPEAIRRQVWDLKTDFDLRLADAGVSDFSDIVLRARDHARRRSAPAYRAAIIDEAQDLTLVGLQLIRTLVNGPEGEDRPDGLLIVGDGAQRIYAGGFTLRQAGVEVRGRTTVLRTNYRNTVEIIAAAMAVAGDDVVEDLGDSYQRATADAEARRKGMRPILVACAGPENEHRYIADRITDLREVGAIDFGDVAVFTPTNKQAEAAAEHLASAGLPVMKLKDYDGRPVDKIKVGTHHRAKGLEFKLVFLPSLGADQFPRAPFPGQSDGEIAEQRALALSQLFVAMTRARDGLFLLVTGNPSPLLGSLDCFELVDA